VKAKLQRRAWALPVCFWLLTAVARQPVSACSLAVTPFEVTDHFMVAVFDRGKPVPALAIELRAFSKQSANREEERVVLTRKTDENGEAAFSEIKSGSYAVTLKNDAFSKFASVFVKKHASKSAEGKITFEWPAVQVLAVQYASGLLNGQLRTDRPLDDQFHPVFQPLSNAKLSLLEAVSGEPIGSLVTSDSGAFSFQATEGLYMLHGEVPDQRQDQYRDISGYIPIEIAQSASLANLNLFLSQGLCGSIGYSNGDGTIKQ
jgi:hypothetical protein